MAESAWKLVFAKRYEEAAEAAAREYAEKGGKNELRGRATTRLLAGRSAEALADFLRVIELTEPKYRDASAFLHCGTCQWYLGCPAEAIGLWRQGLTAPYKDAAGGVVICAFFLYAAVRLKDQALEKETTRLLQGHWDKHQRRTKRGPAKTPRQAHEDFVHPGLYAWPGSLVPFFLGKIGVPELDESARRTDSEILRQRWQCQADFMVAVRSLREGDRRIFQERMALCAAREHGELEHEFCLARWEVLSGFPTEPFATAES